MLGVASSGYVRKVITTTYYNTVPFWYSDFDSTFPATMSVVEVIDVKVSIEEISVLYTFTQSVIAVVYSPVDTTMKTTYVDFVRKGVYTYYKKS